MNAANHPTWLRLKDSFLKPTFKQRSVRICAALLAGGIAWRISGKIYWFNIPIYCLLLIPAFVSIIDLYLRVRFTLLSMMLAIVTLQLPIILFVRADSDIGLGLGGALLIIWVMVIGARIKAQLEEDEQKKQQPEAPKEVRTQ